MNVLTEIASGGVWPALPLTGYWVLRGQRRPPGGAPEPWVTTVAVRTVTGLTVWSGLLLGMALAGWYRAEWLGLAGWAVTLAALAGLWKRRTNRAGVFPRRPFWDWVLAAGLLGAAGLYLQFPTETIFVGADEGVYANHAIYLAHHGRLDVPYPWPPGAAGRPYAATFRPAEENACFVDGFFATEPTMTVQFGDLFPVWLAQGFATGQERGLFRLNAVFALLALSVFYGLACLLVPRPVAVTATLFLALNPSEMWIARITLTEIATQMWIWTGLLVLLRALREEDRQRARWAGAFLGLAAPVRLDGLLLGPLLLLSDLGQCAIGGPEARRAQPVWFALYQTYFPIAGLAVVYYWVVKTPYARELGPFFVAVGLLTGLGLVARLAVVLAGPRILPRLHRWITDWKAQILIGVTLVALTVYGYWLRPRLSRDNFASWTWDHLGRYLSPLVVLSPVGGWFALLRATLRKRAEAAFAVLLVVSAACAALYLSYPFVDAHHFWAIRRFIPVVIPSFVLFAAVGIWWVLSRLPVAAGAAGAALVLLFLAGFTLRAGRPLFLFGEYRGTFHQLAALAAQLPPDDEVVGYGRQRVLAPLYFAFDRKVIALGLEHDQSEARLDAWIAHETGQGRPVYLLTDNCRFPGPHNVELLQTTLAWSHFRPEWNPLATMIDEDYSTCRLYRVTGPPRPVDFLDLPLGGEAVWGVAEAGFAFVVQRSQQFLRATDGRAVLSIPLDEQCLPEALSLDLEGKVPGTLLRVVVNGVERVAAPLRPGRRWFEVVPLSGMPLGTTLEVELESSAPAEEENDGDKTQVPVRILVKEIRLWKNAPSGQEGPP